MALDPNIALGVRPIEIANPLAQYGQVAAIQNAQNQNQLAQYQLGAAQRAEAKDVARTNALAQAGADDTAIANALLKAGDLKGYQEFVKSRRETQKADVELVDAKLKQSRSFLDTINPADPNAPAQYIAWHEANHKDPVLGPALAARGVTADQSRARIAQAIQAGPEAFAQLVNQSKLGTEKFMELNKPTTQVIDQSGQRQVVQQPGLGGEFTTVGTYAAVPLPANVEAQKSRIANAGANRQVMQVNTQLPASEEAQKEFMKEMRQTYGALKQAPTVLDNIEKAKALVPQAKGFMGAGGESVLQAASFLNNRLGTSIDTKGVKSAEELRSRLFLGIMDNLKKLDSQPSQQQQAALQQALGSIGTDPGALPRVLDVFGDTIRQKVDLYNEEASSAEARGVKFPYKPTITLPAAAPAAGGAKPSIAPNIDALLNKYK